MSNGSLWSSRRLRTCSSGSPSGGIFQRRGSHPVQLRDGGGGWCPQECLLVMSMKYSCAKLWSRPFECPCNPLFFNSLCLLFHLVKHLVYVPLFLFSGPPDLMGATPGSGASVASTTSPSRGGGGGGAKGGRNGTAPPSPQVRHFWSIFLML